MKEFYSYYGLSDLFDGTRSSNIPFGNYGVCSQVAKFVTPDGRVYGVSLQGARANWIDHEHLPKNWYAIRLEEIETHSKLFKTRITGIDFSLVSFVAFLWPTQRASYCWSNRFFPASPNGGLEFSIYDRDTTLSHLKFFEEKFREWRSATTGQS